LYLNFMNIKIAIKNKGFNKSYENLILFVDEQFNISSLKKHISSLTLFHLRST